MNGEDGRMDLATFLLARIAEDEAGARSASGGPWHYGDIESVAGGSFYDSTVMIGGVHWDVDGTDPEPIHRFRSWQEADATGRHIAHWNPAHILAECEAKRRIVEAHPLTLLVVPVHTGPQPDVGCETCHTVTAGSVMDPDYVEALGPCETLLALALPYADHPDYRSEWAP